MALIPFTGTVGATYGAIMCSNAQRSYFECKTLVDTLTTVGQVSGGVAVAPAAIEAYMGSASGTGQALYTAFNQLLAYLTSAYTQTTTFYGNLQA